MTYIEKLQSPQWQKKRLEVFERDNFRCLSCDSKDEQLHVHHKTYVWDKDPWDYHIDNFETLCKSCHEIAENDKAKFNDFVHDLLIMGYSHQELHMALHSYQSIINASEQKGQLNG